MIVTLTGDNRYLIDSNIAELIKNQDESENDLGVSRLDGNEIGLKEIKLELSSLSLFSSSRLIILDEPSKIKGFDEYLETEAESLLASTTLILVEAKLDKRRSFYKFLKNKTDFRELTKLARPTLIKWVIDYAAKQGGHISNASASYLIDRVGDDQLLLSQEIQKLAIYSADITNESINLLTEQTPASTIFELLDSAFSINPKRALKLYNDQRLQKVEPEEIMAMISWQLSVLAIYMSSKNLPSDEIISKSGLSPYSLSKAKNIANKLSFSTLKSMVRDLANLDFYYKTSRLDLDEGLKNFIVEIGS